MPYKNGVVSVGTTATVIATRLDTDRTRLVSVPTDDPSNTGNADNAANVESAVLAEINALDGSTVRPGLAAAAVAMARILDNPKAVSSQPPAARVLTSSLDKLRSASAQGRRGRLSVVRTMTEKGGA